MRTELEPRSPPRRAARQNAASRSGRDWIGALAAGAFLVGASAAGASPSSAMTAELLVSSRTTDAPSPNSAFVSDSRATPAPPFAGTVHIAQSPMQFAPALVAPLVGGRDARLFPEVTLQFFTSGDVLVPVERGEMVAETGVHRVASYWRVIAQFGRTWTQAGDGGWSRAAFPIMLVNDTENHAHQGLATFLYRDGAVSRLRFQFVQQTAPYLVKPHSVGWGSADLEYRANAVKDLDARRSEATAELAERLPAKAWSELTKGLPPGTLNGFGGPLDPQWIVSAALVRDGTLYYHASPTPYGDYPYPLEMRFGVRSIMKSVGAPLSLLHLAQVYGPYVLNLRIGDYVKGLDPKYARVRFIDAATMASGFGGVGTVRTHPNDVFDGYLDGEYDSWYTAPSRADKLAQIVANLRPYPWEPGTVMRYRDQDFYLLGAAVDAYLKSVRGPSADVWTMLREEVLAPIGIRHAPAVRTREPDGSLGQVWFNAGYYPTLDDLAKIALLYQARGEHAGKQLLNRELTEDLLAARGAIVATGDGSIDPARAVAANETSELYRMGFHFTLYRSTRTGQKMYIPTMSGSGENEVMLFPNGLVSIRTAKAAGLPDGVQVNTGKGPQTIEAVERLGPL